eukprot:SAG31_NODE_43037_length_269_cov_0.547059_1_plen_69_part_01
MGPERTDEILQKQDERDRVEEFKREVGPSVSRRSCRSKTSVTELLHVLEGGDPPEPCPHLMMTQQPRPW